MAVRSVLLLALVALAALAPCGAEETHKALKGACTAFPCWEAVESWSCHPLIVQASSVPSSLQLKPPTAPISPRRPVGRKLLGSAAAQAAALAQSFGGNAQAQAAAQAQALGNGFAAAQAAAEAQAASHGFGGASGGGTATASAMAAAIASGEQGAHAAALLFTAASAAIVCDALQATSTSRHTLCPFCRCFRGQHRLRGRRRPGLRLWEWHGCRPGFCPGCEPGVSCPCRTPGAMVHWHLALATARYFSCYCCCPANDTLPSPRVC